MSDDEDRPRHLYSAAEAARLFRIPPGSIRAWRAQEKLYEYGLDERGRRLYDKDDLIALRDNTRRRVARKPRRRRSRGV